MDTVTKEQRTLNMSRIRATDTNPEIYVRKILWRMGFRYRLNVKNLPGKPDIYISRIKTAIFVHGCFWHQHDNCKRKSMPKSNIDYWKPKLERNIQRFAKQSEELKKLDINILVIWECEAKKSKILEDKMKSVFLNKKFSSN